MPNPLPEPRPNQCTYVSPGGIRCELDKTHIIPKKSMWGTRHRAWNEEGIPTMLMDS